MNVANTIKKLGLEQAFDYLYKDPENNLLKLMNWADKFSDGEFVSQRKAIREAIENPAHPYHDYILHIIHDIDPEVMKTLAVNFFINASLIGWSKQEENRAKYNCNVPWAILLDPTSACNLHCTGCWAAEYGNKLNLTFDEIDSIIQQGKKLGVYMYIYTGGEPLTRKNDLIRLCEKHNDCVFLCFTNATLIDEKFADEMLRVNCCQIPSSVKPFITVFAICVPRSLCSPWTFKMMRNMWADVLPEASGICISMQTGM